jgi:signal transduction histidine kinase
MALCNRRGQPIWSNATGSKLLLIDGQLNPDVARLVRRAAETLHVASQSLTVRENLRVNVQAVPLGGASVGLIARPMQNQADPNNFYERFMRRIVHDMRNPLAAIIAHASNLYTGPTPENGGSWETWQTTARTIEHEAQRLTRLVDSILFEARLSHVPLAIERLDLVDVIEEVAFQFDEVAQQAGRTLAAETPPGPAPLEADRDLLVRALSNLVDNGLKYSRPASTVRILLEATGEAYLLRVIDSGEGIPPEYLPDRIFEPLVRARPRDGGSGLGLSIVKKIAEMHRGSISAESKPGEGTTMTLCLPR